MSENGCNTSKQEKPPCVEDMKQRVRATCEEMIDYCTQARTRECFFSIEKALQCYIGELACLFFSTLAYLFRGETRLYEMVKKWFIL